MFSNLVSTARSAIIHIRLLRRRIRRLTLLQGALILLCFVFFSIFPLQQVASHFKVVKHAAQKRSCHASQSLTHQHSSDLVQCPPSPSGRNLPLPLPRRRTLFLLLLLLPPLACAPPPPPRAYFTYQQKWTSRPYYPSVNMITLFFSFLPRPVNRKRMGNTSKNVK